RGRRCRDFVLRYAPTSPLIGHNAVRGRSHDPCGSDRAGCQRLHAGQAAAVLPQGGRAHFWQRTGDRAVSAARRRTAVRLARGTILGGCVLLGRIAIGAWFTAAIGLIALVVLFLWKVNNPLLMAVTAGAGLLAFPILHPAWVMVK